MDLTKIAVTIVSLMAALWTPATITLWFFFVRPYVKQREGHSSTAAIWLLSMALDLERAWHVGKHEQKRPWYVYVYATMLVLPLLLFVSVVCLICVARSL